MQGDKIAQGRYPQNRVTLKLNRKGKWQSEVNITGLMRRMEAKFYLLLTVVAVVVTLTTDASPKRKPNDGKRQNKMRPRESGWLSKQSEVVLKKDRGFIKGKKFKTVDVAPAAGIKDSKKSEHYIDPEIFEKISRVKDMKDFIRIFKPKGFSIRNDVSHKGSRNKDFGIEDGEGAAHVDRSIYYEGRKLDRLAESTSKVPPCIPIEIPQSLQSLGKVTYPSCAILKKCGGCCPISQECVAAVKTKKEIDVFEVTGLSFKRVKKTLFEHSSCKCDCIVKASDCHPRQTYSKERCQCECKIAPEKCPSGKKWSIPKCGCACRETQVCPSPSLQWDEDTCNCACKVKSCPSGQAFHTGKCQCLDVSGDARSAHEISDPGSDQFDPDDYSDDDSSEDSFDDFWGDF